METLTTKERNHLKTMLHIYDSCEKDHPFFVTKIDSPVHPHLLFTDELDTPIGEVVLVETGLPYNGLQIYKPYSINELFQEGEIK